MSAWTQVLIYAFCAAAIFGAYWTINRDIDLLQSEIEELLRRARRRP